jgi:hypothetical protein
MPYLSIHPGQFLLKLRQALFLQRQLTGGGCGHRIPFCNLSLDGIHALKEVPPVLAVLSMAGSC